ELRAAIASHSARLHGSLNLASGPLLRVAHFDRGDRHSLLIVIHHLAVDVVSWRILLEDLETLVRQLRQGQTPQLPPSTTSFKTWAERITEHARSGARNDELASWLTSRPIVAVPVDDTGGDNAAVSARTVSVSLTVAETTALLQDVPVAYR